MTLEAIGIWSNTGGAIAYALLALAALPLWRSAKVSSALFVAPALTALQFFTLSETFITPSLRLIVLLQLLSAGAWWITLSSFTRKYASAEPHPHLTAGLLAIWLAMAAMAIMPAAWLKQLNLSPTDHFSLVTLALTVTSIVVLEQVVRNTLTHHRPAIKLIGIGLFAAFGYDLYLSAHSMMFRSIDQSLWNARGGAHALAAGLLLLGLLRLEDHPRITLSRNMVFYTTSLTGSGMFLFAMAAGGYYVRTYGGSWGGVFQVILSFSALLVILAAFSSRHARAYLKVIINKHFFNHKYDYREVWLRLIRQLSKPIEDGEREVYQRSIRAITDIFESPGGCLWLIQESQHYAPVAAMNMPLPEQAFEPAHSPFCKAMREEEWVFSLSEAQKPDSRTTLLPAWLSEIKDTWLVLPLNSEDSLAGFMVLARPMNETPLTWEDLDILRTTGRQIANFIVRHKAAEQLVEAKQFDAYHKLTAFIMHDLKNLIAQQALVVQNAAKHKENPAFIEDAINTIDNSVQRMNSLLKKLQQPEPNQLSTNRNISLNKVLLEAVKKCKSARPTPSLRMQCEDCTLSADHDHLVMILVHLIKNAQDATPEQGFVDVQLVRQGDTAQIRIEDNGEGMESEFIRHRLFRPFDTTKSGKGMGIGAYQAREFVRGLGGEISVDSIPASGTVFTVTLPISPIADVTAAEESSRVTE